MKYIFDTSAYSELVRGHDGMALLVKSAEEIFMPQFSVAELRYGFALGDRQKINEKLLARFLTSPKVRQVSASNATTENYVDIAVYVRKNGKQLSHHDVWIAALAVQYNATLVTFDQDFKYLQKNTPPIQLLTAQFK
jgi:tRNA(fMet)-specific endonuclease VapC